MPAPIRQARPQSLTLPRETAAMPYVQHSVCMSAKRYNVGIIGYGWVSSAHITAINATPHAQVTAVCSSRPLDAGQLNARHGGNIKAYATVDEMLKDPGLHVISVCSYPED